MAGTILVIEDDEASRILACYLLEAAGHAVRAASDGATGFRMALDLRPDLILCDIQMPAMDGYEVAAALRAHPAWRAVPLVAVTAFSMPGDRERALEAGFTAYLSKPINPETFAQQVGSLLACAAAAPPRTAM